MRAAILLCPLFVAACAAPTAKDLQTMPIAEVCYLGMVEPERQQMVLDEVRRRNDDCNKHTAEIKKIQDQEMRAGRMGEGLGDGQRSSGSNTGGGMGGRGY